MASASASSWQTCAVFLLLASSLQAMQPTSNYSSCPTCKGDLEAAKELRLLEIQETILRKLKLERVPNITREELEELPPIPELLSAYLMTSPDGMFGDQAFGVVHEPNDDDDEEFQPTEAAIFADTETSQKYVEISSYVVPENLFQFKISATLLMQQLENAEFMFHLSCNVMNEIGDFTAVVEKIVRSGYSGFRTKKGGAVHVRVHQCGHDGRWIQINVKPELESWFRSVGEENLGLKLRIYDQRGRDVNIPLPTHGKHRPFLKIQLSSYGKSRVRRSTSARCDEQNQQVTCCRYPFTVNFHDFGWDWIIEPRKYEANYCSGKCEFPVNSRQHVVSQQIHNLPESMTIEQQQLIKKNPISPCCAPRKLRSISMLYFDDQRNILHGVLPAMAVASCACL